MSWYGAISNPIKQMWESATLKERSRRRPNLRRPFVLAPVPTKAPTATSPTGYTVESTAAADALRNRAAAVPPPTEATAPVAGTVNPFADAYQQQQDREDALAEASMGLVGMDDERALLERQLGYADQDVNTAMPEGRTAGRVFVAANPLEFVGAAAKQIRGRKQREEAMGKIEGVNTRRKDLIGGVIGALRNRSKKPKIEGESDAQMWGLGG